MNFGQIRTNIKYNLHENGITDGYYADSDINEVMTDAYNVIAVRTQFLTKTAVINQIASNYIVPSTYIPDYMGTVCIFNSLSNLWLFDNLSIRDFNRLRRDWELWNGNTQYWAPHSFNRIVVVPYNLTPTGTFTVVYWALPPAWTQDTDIPLVATDQQTLIEYYSTADLIESAKENAKAQDYWDKFNSGANIYKKRSKDRARLGMLARV